MQKWLCTSLPGGARVREPEPWKCFSCTWPVLHHARSFIYRFFFNYSFPEQGLALSREAPPQPASLNPTISHYTPAMAGAGVGMRPARYLPPHPSTKATTQVWLFFSLLLKAILLFNYHRVISCTSLPILHWYILSSKWREPHSIPYPWEMKQ